MNINSGLPVGSPILSRLFNKVTIFPILAFLIPLAVRTIPELLMGEFVVGFDNLGYYVPKTILWLNNGVAFWNFLATAPLFYVLLMGVTSVGIPIVISLKVMAPLFLGLLGFVVYLYSNKTLQWSNWKSLGVALFGTLYFVSLRVSWDLLRSELALVFLFVVLIFIGNLRHHHIRNGIGLSLAMVLVVLTNQIISVLMLFIVLVTIIIFFYEKKMTNLFRVVICSVPAAILFLLVIYANYVIFPQFSIVSDFSSQSSEGFMSIFGFSSAFDLIIDTVTFPLFCYLPILPLVLIGFRKFKGNIHLNSWLCWILIALCLVIISPNASFVITPYRWTLLLVYPLAFFVTESFVGLKSILHKLSIGLILATFSFAFIFLPTSLAFPYFGCFTLYFPTSMLQNTVSLQDCPDTVNALHWVRNNLENDESLLLVHDVFYGFALLNLDFDDLIPYGYKNPEFVAQELVENGLDSSLYLIWWTEGNDWHGTDTLPPVFEAIYQSGDIAVYSYTQIVIL